jgi:hypothetical protein
MNSFAIMTGFVVFLIQEAVTIPSENILMQPKFRTQQNFAQRLARGNFHHGLFQSDSVTYPARSLRRISLVSRLRGGFRSDYATLQQFLIIVPIYIAAHFLLAESIQLAVPLYARSVETIHELLKRYSEVPVIEPEEKVKKDNGLIWRCLLLMGTVGSAAGFSASRFSGEQVIMDVMKPADRNLYGPPLGEVFGAKRDIEDATIEKE